MLDLELLRVRDPIRINGSDTDKLYSSFVARVTCAPLITMARLADPSPPRRNGRARHAEFPGELPFPGTHA